MARRTSARAIRLKCPKCMSAFTVVAYISNAIDRMEYLKQREQEHDCAAHAKLLAQQQNGDGTKNPLKASKAAARGK